MGWLSLLGPLLTPLSHMGGGGRRCSGRAREGLARSIMSMGFLAAAASRPLIYKQAPPGPPVPTGANSSGGSGLPTFEQ
jgi:hypothetical protein